MLKKYFLIVCVLCSVFFLLPSCSDDEDTGTGFPDVDHQLVYIGLSSDDFMLGRDRIEFSYGIDGKVDVFSPLQSLQLEVQYGEDNIQLKGKGESSSNYTTDQAYSLKLNEKSRQSVWYLLLL